MGSKATGRNADDTEQSRPIPDLNLNQSRFKMIKQCIQRLLRGRGLELRRYHSNSSEHRARERLLAALDIGLVLDVGANCGQFAEELLDCGYRGRIVSFEPLSSAHAMLSKRCLKRGNRQWIVHGRTAIGSNEGTASIYIAGNSVSSSLLTTLESHLRAAPDSAVVGKELVQVARLDDAATSYVDGERGILMKIDTQGFEWQVLDGARALLESASAVQLELSLVPLYEGQRLWLDFIDRLARAGYSLYFAYPAFTNDLTGQTLQWDACFVRSDLLPSLKY